MNPHPTAQPTAQPTSQRTPLSLALRDGSADEHRHAESSPFVGDLLAGRVSREAYAAYLQRLRVVYRTLEDAVRAHRHHPAVAAVHDEALVRADALDRDLEHWSAAAGCDPALEASPAATAYAARVEEARLTPELLVAHHYTRYLGDLSGGRMLATGLRRHYGAVVGDGGLDFYDFPSVPKPVAYKRAYRERLDALPLDAAQQRALVDEVRRAFGLNRDLLDELAVGAPSA